MDGTDAFSPLEGATNVLLLGPSVERTVDAGCKHLLSADAGRSVLAVSFTQPPAQWIARWDERVGERPPATTVVTTSDTFTGPRADEDVGDDVDVEYLSSPGDLTGLGMLISKYLERWHDQERRIALCFDSLTTLLQYDDLENVYRFLHLITTRLASADARAHFHLDPATQKDQSISTIASTFDAVARYEDDGWEIRTR